MRDDVRAALNKNCNCAVNVSTKMTRFYPPLYLAVNGHANKFMKNKVNSLYTSQITRQLDQRMKLDQVNGRILIYSYTSSCRISDRVARSSDIGERKR